MFESLLKKADARSDKEVKLLVLLLQNMKVFNNLSNNILTHLSNKLGLVHSDANKYIIREGEIGNEYYVLLVGSVDIILGEEKVLTLKKPGSGFGELALLAPDSKRVASVVTTTPSTFITI